MPIGCYLATWKKKGKRSEEINRHNENVELPVDTPNRSYVENRWSGVCSALLVLELSWAEKYNPRSVSKLMHVCSTGVDFTATRIEMFVFQVVSYDYLYRHMSACTSLFGGDC